MKKWLNKPITWGGYLKLCGISALISIPMSFAGIMMMYFPEKVLAFFRKIKRRFQRMGF